MGTHQNIIQVDAILPAERQISLSQSIQHDLACKRMYAEKHKGEWQDPGNEFSLRGQDVHDFFFAYVSHLVKAGKTQDVEVANGLQRQVTSADAAEIIENQIPVFKIDPDTVLETEKRLYLDEDFNPLVDVEPSDPRIAYDGKPDLVCISGNVARIPDYKSQFQIVAADSFQGLLYSLLVMQHHAWIEKVIFELLFVRYGSASRKVEYTREQIPAMKKRAARERQRLLEIEAMVRAGVVGDALPATPGDHCTYCPLVLSGCPIKGRNFYADHSPEDLAKMKLVAEAGLKRIDALLKQHVGINGPFHIEDGNGEKYEAGFSLVEKHERPLDVGLPVLQKWDRGEFGNTKENLMADLTIGGLSSKLKAKKRQPLAEEFAKEGMSVVSYESHFYLKKVKPE